MPLPQLRWVGSGKDESDISKESPGVELLLDSILRQAWEERSASAADENATTRDDMPISNEVLERQEHQSNELGMADVGVAGHERLAHNFVKSTNSNSN